MLYVPTVECFAPETMIAGRLDPVHISLPAPAPMPPQHRASRTEIDAVLAALGEGRGTSERTIDRVVDRLMNELSW